LPAAAQPSGKGGELPAQASSRRCDAFAEELSPDHDVFEATDQLSGAVADLDRMGVAGPVQFAAGIKHAAVIRVPSWRGLSGTGMHHLGD